MARHGASAGGRSLFKKFSATIGAMALIGGTALAVSLPSMAADQQCQPSNGDAPYGVGNNVNVYAGGDFTRASSNNVEIGAPVVIAGDAHFGSGAYQLGQVAGGGLAPTGNAVVLRVGGNVTGAGPVNAQSTNDGITGGGDARVRIGGSNPGTVNGYDVQAGVADPLEEYADFASKLGPLADSLVSDTDVLGSADVSPTGITLSRGAAPLASSYLFEIDAAELGTTQRAFTIADDIPAGSNLVIRVTGSDATVNINGTFRGSSAVLNSWPGFGDFVSHIAWVFPNATSVTLMGADVPGSIIVPTAGSTTYHKAMNTNGRVWVGGDLVHDGPAGSEFHPFPYLGHENMLCDPEPWDEPNDSPTPATPVAPGVEDDQCFDAGTDAADVVTVTPATTTGVSYSVNKSSSGNTVTVTVTATPDTTHELTLPSVSDWTLDTTTGVATWTNEYVITECAPPTCEVTIGDFVWLDGNGNGTQDPGEVGIPNVEVKLLLNGDVYRQTTTDPNGYYVFDELECGIYTVEFPPTIQIDGEEFELTDQGDKPAAGDDSNPDPDTGLTGPVTVDQDGDVDLTIDAGYKKVTSSPSQIVPITPDPQCVDGEPALVAPQGTAIHYEVEGLTVVATIVSGSLVFGSDAEAAGWDVDSSGTSASKAVDAEGLVCIDVDDETTEIPVTTPSDPTTDPTPPTSTSLVDVRDETTELVDSSDAGNNAGADSSVTSETVNGGTAYTGVNTFGLVMLASLLLGGGLLALGFGRGRRRAGSHRM